MREGREPCDARHHRQQERGEPLEPGYSLTAPVALDLAAMAGVPMLESEGCALQPLRHIS